MQCSMRLHYSKHGIVINIAKAIRFYPSRDSAILPLAEVSRDWSSPENIFGGFDFHFKQRLFQHKQESNTCSHIVSQNVQAYILYPRGRMTNNRLHS